MVDVKYEGEPLTLTIGEPHVIELPPRILRVRLTGVLFETDKTFLLPRAMRGIRGIVDLYSDHGDMTVVVTGHTDTVGSASYNLGLSDERARSIAHYLRDEVEDWLEWYTKQPFSSAWGVREDQHMLSAITDEATGEACYQGSPDGVLDAGTRDAVERYQTSRGLGVDGQPGTETRRALVTDYMGLDGTTLPAGADVQLLGCGEHHNEVPTSDGVDEERNRRAEIFLFDPGPATPPVPARCPGSGCPYETWQERTAETYDFEHDLGKVLVECHDDEDGGVGQVQVALLRSTETERQGMTGEDGRIQFEDLFPGRYTVSAEKEDHETASKDVEVSGGATEIRIEMGPAVDWDVFAFEVVSAEDEERHGA